MAESSETSGLSCSEVSPRFDIACLVSRSRAETKSSSCRCMPVHAGIHVDLRHWHVDHAVNAAIQNHRHSGAGRNPVTLCIRASVRYAPGSLFLCLCKEESNQKESTPRGCGRWASCPSTARGRYGGLSTARPCADDKLVRIHAHDPTGFSFAAPPHPRGPGRSKARASCAPSSQIARQLFQSLRLTVA